MTHTYPIAFHGDTLNLIEHDGKPFVAVKPITNALGLDWKTQYRKLTSEISRWGMVIMPIPSAGGIQETVCIPLRRLFSWLASISPSKVAERARPALELYQAKCDEILEAAWTGVQSDRERKSETRSIALLAEVCTKKPILGKVLPLALADRTFAEIKAAWPNYTKARIVEALEDLVRLKSLDRLPDGVPILKSQNVISNPTNDTLPLFA